MKVAVYVVVAVALGLLTMFAPLLAFTVYGYQSVISQSEVGREFISERVRNETDINYLGGNNSNVLQSLSFSEAAQLYGWMDTVTEPFPTSFAPAILIVAAGIVAAFGVVFFYKSKA
jgi:hypothetical protein